MHEAIKAEKFDLIDQLMSKYDYTLKVVSAHFIGYVIDSLIWSPYFLEFKLQLIYYFLQHINENQAFKLLSNFTEIITKADSAKSSFILANIQSSIHTVLMNDIANRIQKNFPQYKYEKIEFDNKMSALRFEITPRFSMR